MLSIIMQYIILIVVAIAISFYFNSISLVYYNNIKNIII